LEQFFKVVRFLVLNQATEYAMRMSLFLSKKGSSDITDAASISAREKIPKRFLFKIARELTRVGIVKSVRGKDGGFMLARRPEEITLYDIIEAVEGSIPLNKCLLDPNKCNKDATAQCRLRKELEKMRKEQIHKFQSINLKMLVEGA
jgi:Rrf2 family protein